MIDFLMYLHNTIYQIFSQITIKKREEYSKIFEDVKTVASMCDDFVRQLKCFTEKQDIYNIQPIGIQKIILLRE